MGSNTTVFHDDSLDRYMAEINRHPLLSREDEKKLAVRLYAHDDVAAAHKLVVSNLRFVVKIAHGYKGYGLKLLDMVQEGNVGLMTAVKKFNPHKGYRLISYAVWWIRAYIQAFILRSWSMVKLGSSRMQRKLFFKLRSVRSAAENDAAMRGEALDGDELAQRLGAKKKDVRRMEARLAARDFSLDATLTEDGTMTHLDMVTDASPDPEAAFAAAEEKALLRSTLAEAMGSLNAKERRIVDERLLADEPATLQKIGDDLHVSRERIRQLEQRVIAKLRGSFAAKGEIVPQVA